MKYVDIHSHILPYLDDGAKNEKMSLDMLRLAQSEGISDIIVTPHYQSGRYRGDRKEMERILELYALAMPLEGGKTHA